MDNQFMRIFNFRQANFLYQNGAIIENLGYSYETGKPYVRFKSDETFKNKMIEWKERCNTK